MGSEAKNRGSPPPEMGAPPPPKPNPGYALETSDLSISNVQIRDLFKTRVCLIVTSTFRRAACIVALAKWNRVGLRYLRYWVGHPKIGGSIPSGDCAIFVDCNNYLVTISFYNIHFTIQT